MPGGSVPEGPTTWPWHRASNAVIDSLTHKDKGEPYEANHSLARSPDRLFLAGLALGRRRLRWRWHDDAASGHDSGALLQLRLLLPPQGSHSKLLYQAMALSSSR